MNDAVKPVTGIALVIRRGDRRVLNLSEISIGSAACTAIVGPNGAGKSLLIRALSGLLKPDEGSVQWSGKTPDKHHRQRVGLLLQRPVLLRRSALENVVYPLRVAGMSRSQASVVARQALDNAGLAALADVFALRLSGGEQQRLALVRALVLKPDMLFLDEATANVDVASTLAIEQQLQSAMKAGLCVVLVSHDMGQVRRLADEVVLMHNGAVVEHSSRQHFFEHTNNPVSRRWLAGELLV